MRTEYIKKVTQSLISLPTLPTVAAQLFELTDNVSERGELEQIISSDPVLTARLLKMTNSRGESVTGIHTAITKLGVEQVRDISLEASMSNVFALKNATVDLQKFWDHCSAVGIAARTIAQEYEPSLSTDAFTAGLLHDIGKVVLLQYMGREFEQAIEKSRLEKRDLFSVEKEMLGVDHGQIGAWLAENWQLPRSIQEVMQYHHDLSRCETKYPLPPPMPPSGLAGGFSNRPLVALVAFADILCRILKAGDGGNYAPPEFSEALENELAKWKIDLDINALQPILLLCIDELNKRGITNYGA
ncbi:HD family phosphohydrolase [Fibrobacterales bacterium]|nr:HD family phosphohydrolase [Fibrobacterales bacterium]